MGYPLKKILTSLPPGPRPPPFSSAWRSPWVTPSLQAEKFTARGRGNGHTFSAASALVSALNWGAELRRSCCRRRRKPNRQKSAEVGRLSSLPSAVSAADTRLRADPGDDEVTSHRQSGRRGRGGGGGRHGQMAEFQSPLPSAPRRRLLAGMA